jgi:hypothetical protein
MDTRIVVDRLTEMGLIHRDGPVVVNNAKKTLKLINRNSADYAAMLTLFAFYNLAEEAVIKSKFISPQIWLDSVLASDTIWPCPQKLSPRPVVRERDRFTVPLHVLTTSPKFPRKLASMRILRKLHLMNLDGKHCGCSQIDHLPSLKRVLLEKFRRHNIKKILDKQTAELKVKNSTIVDQLTSKITTPPKNIKALLHTFTLFSTMVSNLLNTEYSYVANSTLLVGINPGKVINIDEPLPNF